MRWNCLEEGCFNHKARPKLEQFAACLPRNAAFTDIDGATEINGRFMFQEWKSRNDSLGTGQRLMFERLTKALGKKSVVLVIHGSAKDMRVWGLQVIQDGKTSQQEKCNLKELQKRIEDWFSRD